MSRQLNRLWLLDQLRFFKVQLRLHRYHRLAGQAHALTEYILDLGVGWTEGVPIVRLFLKEADETLSGRPSYPIQTIGIPYEGKPDPQSLHCGGLDHPLPDTQSPSSQP